MLSRKWIKLYVKKGPRRARAHKKWMKKTGLWAWLRGVEAKMQREMETPQFQQEFNTALEDAALFGTGGFSCNILPDMEHIMHSEAKLSGGFTC